MECCEFKCKLGTFLDGELPLSERAEVEVHCRCCADCRVELAELQAMADRIASIPTSKAPPLIWLAVSERLDQQRPNPTRTAVGSTIWWRRPISLAAMIALVISVGWLGIAQWETKATASTVNFAVLLDGLSFDPHAAFDKFVRHHGGRTATVEAARRHASKLDFEVPEELPGGFVLGSVYVLEFGNDPGVAAAYTRNGEFLAAIFHAAVKQEHFGTHKDLPCVVGDHHGHKVEVGQWRLVHVTDPTTCHCVLSQLDETSGLSPILKAVAPRSVGGATHHHP